MVLNAILDSTSLIVIGIFLLVTLVVGLYAGRNVKNFKDYSIGNRKFSTFALVISLLATDIGANTLIGNIGLIYKHGIIVTIFLIFGAFDFILTSIILGKKIRFFKNCITLGQVMGNIYGEKVQFITGVFSLILSIAIVSIQLVALGKFCSSILNIEFYNTTILMGCLLILYTVIGGIKSVLKTDILHFIIIITIIPLCGFFLLNKVGGIKELFIKLPKDTFKILENNKFGYFFVNYFLLSFLPGGALTFPAIMNRILLSKNSKQVEHQLTISGIFIPVFRVCISIIALCSIVLLSKDNSTLPILYKIFPFLNLNLKIGLFISIIAIIFTTMDSYLHSASLTMVEDFGKIFIKKEIKKLKTARISVLILGICAILIALKFQNFIEICFSVVGIILPCITPSLVLGIYGFKSTFKNFLFPLFLTIISYFFLKSILSDLSYIIPLLILILNFFSYLILHLIQNKGIAIINRDYDQNKPQRIWKPTWQGFLETLFSYIPTPHKIFEFSRKSVSRCGANNMLFGIFVCINFIVPYFMWDHKNEDLYNLMIYLRFFGGLLGGLLIVKSEWKDFLKPYFPLFWHFTLLYCLPFISTVMFLLTNGSIIWLLNIGTSIFFLIMLTENIVFLTLTPIGIVLGILFYILRVGPVDLSSFGFEVNYQLIYQVLFSSTIGLLFSYRKKIFNSIKGNEGTNLGLAMCHELRNTGLYIYPAAQISLMYLKKYRNNFKEINKEKGYFIKEKDFEYIDEQNLEIERLGRLQKNIVGTFEKLLKEYRDSINDPQNFSMKYIINQAIDQYIFKPGQKEKLDINLNKDFIAKIPKQVFIFVVDNIIRNSYKHGNPSKIKIWLEENELHIKDNGKGISEREMDLIFKMYFTNGDSSSSGIGLAFAKQIVEGFGGEIWVESQTGSTSFTEFIIKFPKVSEELSGEEIKENMELEIKKNIAESLKKDGIEESVIVKATGISMDDLEGNE